MTVGFMRQRRRADTIQADTIRTAGGIAVATPHPQEHL
jgi:hypothetical protein